jgi:hypothetical protein
MRCAHAPLGREPARKDHHATYLARITRSLRNTCSGNLLIHWVVAANNVCGPILDRTVVFSAAISGDSAPDSTGSIHPNANFTY